MEAMIFCTTIGLLLAATFILIGVGIGEINVYYHQKYNKSDRRDVRDRHSDSAVHNCGTCNGHDRSLGDVHREEPCRCSVGYLHEVDNECLATFLRTFLITGGHLTPGEKDHFEEIITRLEGEYDTEIKTRAEK